MKKEPFNRRTMTALTHAGFPADCEGALAKLVEFAAGSSGIKWRDYFNDVRELHGLLNYRRDCRQIARDWQEFRRALRQANSSAVKDADVISAASRTNSGRLSWNGQLWDYCPGQYYCIEYRRAALAVLELAIRTARRAQPRRRVRIPSIQDLKDLHIRNGGCWFDRNTMRFFGTRIETGVLKGRYFITSEQPPHGARKYSVRQFDQTGNIDTFGEFCGYGTKRAAIDALPALIEMAVKTGCAAHKSAPCAQ